MNHSLKIILNLIYFSEPLDVAQKITSSEPRNLEEEGYYVESNHIRQKHLNIIEKRLLTDENNKYI